MLGDHGFGVSKQDEKAFLAADLDAVKISHDLLKKSINHTQRFCRDVTQKLLEEKSFWLQSAGLEVQVVDFPDGIRAGTVGGNKKTRFPGLSTI